MIPIHQIEQKIPNLAGCAVVIIAGCSFILSFFNLQAVATEAGIDPLLSGLWPVCIDALLVAGSLMILRSSIRDESALEGWFVLLVFTGISTMFNVLHSPEGLINQAAHAIPPVALCVSIELLMMTIKSDLTSQGPGHTCTCHNDTDQIDEHPCTCNTCTEYTAYTDPDTPVLKDCTPICSDEISIQPDERSMVQPMTTSYQSIEQVDRTALIREHFSEHPESSVSAAAKQLGMSRSTVSRHLSALVSAGVINR
jgi:hypothetical protein